MAINRDEVCIFIPTLNEAPTIGSLIKSFRDLGYNHILVMDGHSGDGTPDIARNEGATVRVQKGRGKGNAIIEAVQFIEEPYILMLDGDGTYLPEESDIMLEPLFAGADHVIGNRLVHPEPGALSRLNSFGNEVINYLFKVAHGRFLGDILSGYRAFTHTAICGMRLKEAGFEIETEMAVEAVRNNQNIVVVPVQYKMRPGTPTKLHPFKDGARIIVTLYRLARLSNPLFYFGFMGIIMSLIGAIIGIYVTVDWFHGIEHIPLTILTVLLITVGIQIFMLGVISDLLLSFNKEIRDEIQRLCPPEK